ncbi:hypothetical protein GCM10027055_07120 [Janibacter alkaliphilus]|uniref:Crotonobetainyl-CoA:carnitine CoA-transferase CaiB-like acyl-CoA transferase n=1 Tax=Janibacter alkaliphilus TaxID=1069963 RepID=A0A852XCL6_9MICO|nr:crotonobetainyl-CoA:carnitine CoA-transferase CaiB-like acyl-CoA transferase [Janibacter alkaliphilus]
MTEQPLAGVRVLELSSYVATPLCGLTLAQLGADVVRVEPPGGAPDRTRLPLAPGGTSYYWTGLNKGKRAVEIDLGSDDGRQAVADLAGGADVVVANAPYRSFDQAAAELGEHPLFAELDQPGIGRHRAPGSPLVVDGERTDPRPAPRVGQHTDEVVTAALGADTTARLHQTSAIGAPDTPTRRSA